MDPVEESVDPVEKLSLKQKLEKYIRDRFVKMHGEGASNQVDFYRCYSCGKLLTWNFIRSGNRCCAGRVVPTNPRLLEYPRIFLIKS